MADPLSETPLKTIPGGPPEQIFLRSYTGDHGRPYFATVLGTGEIGPRRWSAGCTKRKPPKHGFYSCSAYRRHPKGAKRNPPKHGFSSRCASRRHPHGNKRSPPKHGFSSCCASRRHPKRGRQIADSILDSHPTRANQVHEKVFSPRYGALGREADGRRTGGTTPTG